MANDINIEFNVPKIFIPLFNSTKRYNILYGGRGSGKSWAAAYYCIIKAIEKKRRILCTREIQRTIKDSVYKLLTDIIKQNEYLQKMFVIRSDAILCVNGSEFIFKGLRQNVQEIKSTEGIDICWVEEAQSISAQSDDILTPTIRKKESKIIYTYNPYEPKDVVYTKYIMADRDDVLAIKANYYNNPYLPDVLIKEAEYDKIHNITLYKHKWEGEFVQRSELLVLADKLIIDMYEYQGDVVIRYGVDWGFSVDATAVVKVVIDTNNNVLYIEQEAYGVGIDIDRLPELFDQVEGIRGGLIIADSARPETISYMKQRGFNIRGSIKGAKSKNEGIAFLRSFKHIIINPMCKNTIAEFSNYKYKADKITGEPLSEVEDGNDHTIDATRYAIEDLMRLQRAKFKIL